MGWKVYFWIFTGLSAIGFIFGYGKLENWTLGALFEVVTSILAVVALYSYIYHKHILSSIWWKVLFWSWLVLDVFEYLYTFSPVKYWLKIPEVLQGGVMEVNGSLLIFVTIISIPLYYCLYRLSYFPSNKR
jgi:hypothetical protein